MSSNRLGLTVTWGIGDIEVGYEQNVPFVVYEGGKMILMLVFLVPPFGKEMPPSLDYYLYIKNPICSSCDNFGNSLGFMCY